MLKPRASREPAAPCPGSRSRMPTARWACSRAWSRLPVRASASAVLVRPSARRSRSTSLPGSAAERASRIARDFWRLASAPAVSPRLPWFCPPWTSPIRKYASASSRSSVGSRPVSRASAFRYLRDVSTRSARTGVDPGSGWTPSWSSYITVCASALRSSKRFFARASFRIARRASQIATPAPPAIDATTSTAAAAPTACRRTNFRVRYASVSLRASTGSPSRCRRRSSESCSTEPYRRSGCFWSAFSRIVSRSSPSRLRALRGLCSSTARETSSTEPLPAS